ncbi:hypothetical protein JCM14469_40610 [Desulfatiferula olefinivorans]
MKTVRFTAWAIACLLFLMHTAVVVTHAGLSVYKGGGLGPTAAGYGTLLGLAAVMLGAGLIKGRLTRSDTYLMLSLALIGVMVAGLAWLAADEPAISDDYSEEDLACPANGSYAYLSLFIAEDTRESEEYENDAAAWDAILARRNAIDALDRIDRICDLPDDAAFTISVPMLRLRPFKETIDIYERRVLSTIADDSEEAVETLCRLNRVTRKGMSQATLLIHKILFAHAVERTIETVWTALQSRALTPRTLTALNTAFVPIETDEISLVRPMIAEYLIMKNTLTSIEPKSLMTRVSLDSGRVTDPSFVEALWSRAVYALGFKPNRSLSDMHIFYDLLIDAHRRYPVDTSRAEAYMEAYAKNPPVRNMIGWILNSMAAPSVSSFTDRLDRVKIKSDLLALALTQKLNPSVIPTDAYAGEDLRYQQQNGMMRHPGRDGVFETDDDVVLGETR